MTGTKEFYELMNMFERETKQLMYGHRVERYTREEKEHIPANQFYTDGFVNDMFQAFMSGYQYRKALEL